MSIAPKLDELKKLDDAAIIAAHDNAASSTVVGVRYFLDELRARENAKVSASLEKLTKRMYLMTLVIMAATIVNVAVYLLDTFRS